MYSKYDVYTDTQSIYCYADTNILKNKLNIKDSELLKKAEEDITAVKQMELLRNPIKGRFTKNHLLRIHRFIFEDIYPFAGRIRLEQISKSTTMFYPPNLIDQQLDKLFTMIKTEKMLKSLDQNVTLNNLSSIMAELNIIHPFREGNGRTIREFIREMANSEGYSINWGNVNHDEILKYSILSVDDHEVLKNILEKCLE